MSHLFPAGYLALAAVAAALVCTPLSGCDDSVVSKRRGGEGESCTSTDDCQSPLKCFANVCLAEPAAGGASPCSCTGSGGSGAGQCTCSGCGGSAAAGGSSGTGGSSTSSSGGGTGGTTATGGSGGATGTGGSAGGPVDCSTGIWPAYSVDDCDDCLDTLCAAELAACDCTCVAVEACIETVCRALTDASQESLCFQYCQNTNLGGKQPHLDVAWCAYYSSSCFPPCFGYSVNYPECRTYMHNGPCATEWEACQIDIDCQLYLSCTSACTTFSDCTSCSSTAAGLAGRQLYEAYEHCIATECIAESWM